MPSTRIPVFVALFLGLLGLGPARAAPLGAAPSPDLGPLAFALAIGLLVALALGRTLPRLRIGQALKLAAVLLLAGAGLSAARAGTVDLTPVAQAAVDDVVRPVLVALASAVAAVLVMPLKRFLDERSASELTGRVNDLFDKGIAYGVDQLDAKLASGTLDLQVGISNPLAEIAASYAIDHAPCLMKRAAGAVGPKLVALLQQKAKARLGSHPDVLALKATVAARAGAAA